MGKTKADRLLEAQIGVITETAMACLSYTTAELHRATSKLITSTPGASTLNEVAAVKGRDFEELLAEQMKMDEALVRAVIAADEAYLSIAG